MSAALPPGSRPFSLLRQFLRPRSPAERCELCSAVLAPEHMHLLDPARRQLVCSCSPCALLFSGQEGGRFLRVPSVLEALRDFRLTDAQWESLHIPINMAFFCHGAAAGKVQAYYPSPAGATESLLTLEAWQELEDQNPALRKLEPDVEALLVNRVNGARDCYRVSIDECYKLVGLIRLNWRGLSGGTEVWAEIARFFARLRERSCPAPEQEHA
jgi:hypothetical protein